MHKNEKQGAWAAFYRVATECLLVKACACLFVPRCPCLFYCCSTWVYWLEVKAFWNNYTSGSLKMNRTFVLLFAGFIAAIKVFVNLQTAASPSKVSFLLNISVSRVCVRSECQSNLLPVESALQRSITELWGYWSPRTDKEEEARLWNMEAALMSYWISL